MSDKLLKINTEYIFKKIHGFTFVFKEEILAIKNQIASGEIKPIGIIYEENGEYYFAPLDEVDDIKPIIKIFVENYLK